MNQQIPSQPQPASSATFKIAINRTVKNKPENDDKAAWAALTKRFESCDLTVAELIDSIRSGYSFCAQHRNSRKSSNFQCMQVLAVDIDSGSTVEAASQSPFFQQFGSFIYTTVNHQPDAHRFRIVFVMEVPITDEKRMRAAYTGIIRKFGGDRSCNDACRMFFGAEGCEVYFVGKTLPLEQVEYLIELGDNEVDDDQSKKKTASKDERKMTKRSSDALADDEVVMTARQGRHALADLKSGTRIFCPKHDDQHASAMVVTSKRKQNGVYCSACARTFWPAWHRREELLSFDFSGFENSLLEIAHEEHPFEWLDGDAPLEYRHMKNDAGIFERNTRYLAPKKSDKRSDTSGFAAPIVRDGVTFVRSPKGTGKTEWLEQFVAQSKAEGVSVLLIGHRQALLQSLAHRLGLHCYLDKIDEYDDPDLVKRYYAVCLDSIGKLDPLRQKFDVVIIDESEQVFSHITSSTLRGKRNTCFFKLHHYVQQAKRAVLSDADLGWLTVNVTDTLRAGKGPSYVYMNRYRKSDEHTLHMYSSRDHLMERVFAAVKVGGKQYVACNSKDDAKTIAEAVSREFGSVRRVQLITSENSGDEKVQRFIKSISDAVVDCDVLIVSPALGTGVDISIKVEAHMFTHVFGLFGAGITTHFDMDQQLARVRNMKAQHVWVSPALRFFEYEVDAIRGSLLANGALPELLRGYTSEGAPDYDTDSKLLDVFAQVMSMRYASLNNVREHFLSLKRSEGWKVVDVAAPEMSLKPTAEKITDARASVKKQELDAVVNAKPITAREFKELKVKVNASLNEQMQLRRYRITEFYGVRDVTHDLVALDDNGRYRESVQLFSWFTGSKTHHLWLTFTENDRLTVERKGYKRKCDLLKKLLHAAGVVDESGAIIPVGRFETESLAAFIGVVKAEAVNIGLVLGTSVREDFEWKPMSQLSAFLKLIGLSLGDAKVRYVGGKKIYSYGLDLVSLERIQAYSAHFCAGLKGAHGALDSETGEWDLVVTNGKIGTAKRPRVIVRDNRVSG